MNQNQNTTIVTTMQFFSDILVPIVVATAIVLPLVFLLGKGMLWGVKEK